MKNQFFLVGLVFTVVVLAAAPLIVAQDCATCGEGQEVEFDSSLIAPKPVDQASVEQAFLVGQDYTMLGQQGNLVRFVIRDDRLPGGEGTFSFNVKTYQIVLDKAGNYSDQPLVVFADAAENGQVRVQTVGAGCWYNCNGPTHCFGRTLYAYCCPRGSWYCFLFPCRWIPIGCC